MKFKIGEQVNPTNVFQVEVRFMHGDADAYTTEVFNVGVCANNAIPCIEFFQRCEARHENGMGGDDGYWDVPGYYPEGVTDETDPEHGYRINEAQWEIPANSEYCDGHASIEHIKMFWYSNSGSKHEVTYG